ncbi:hypothetical protein N7451_001584 [Penicillium sp. IBT 35674x]|nr:hypothetical protein N7451_001584 [Penicillium sp. IBT 35674x]
MKLTFAKVEYLKRQKTKIIHLTLNYLEKTSDDTPDCPDYAQAFDRILFCETTITSPWLRPASIV